MKCHAVVVAVCAWGATAFAQVPASPAPASPAPSSPAPSPPSSSAPSPASAGTASPELAPPAAPEAPEAPPATSPSAAAPLADDAAPNKKKDKRGERKLRLAGYLQVYYRYSFHTGEGGNVDPSNFRVQRARLSLDGDLSRWVSYEVSIEPRAPELSGMLRDAYLAFHVIPRHEIRLGQEKTTFGYENNVSTSKLYMVNRAEVSEVLGQGLDSRDTGVFIEGWWKLTDQLRLEDGFSLVNGSGLNATEDDNRDKNLFARLGLRYQRDALTVRGGVSGARGDFLDAGEPELEGDDTAHRFLRLGVDLQVDTPWLVAQAEWITGHEEATTAAVTTEEDLYGYYVTLLGKLGHRAGPLVRVDALGDDHLRFTFGGYYGLAEDTWRVLVNYELRQRREGERGDDKLYLWTQARF
jgi:hypothetical protein